MTPRIQPCGQFDNAPQQQRVNHRGTRRYNMEASMSPGAKLIEVSYRLKEQTVLENELGSLRKNAEVYRQQQNSGVFFLSSVQAEKRHCKHTIEQLKKELDALETHQKESG